MLLSTALETLSDDAAVMTFQGPLTLGTSLKFADAQVQAAINQGFSKFVFDLTGVDHMDSAGLGFLVFTHGALSQHGGILRLCGVGPKVLSVIQLTRTESLLTIDPTRDQSIQSISQS